MGKWVSACRILFANALTFTAQHNTWLGIPLCRRRRGRQRRRRRRRWENISNRSAVWESWVECVAVNTLNLFSFWIQLTQSLRTFVAREEMNCWQILIFWEHVVIRELPETPTTFFSNTAALLTSGWRIQFLRLRKSEQTMWPHPSLNSYHKADAFKAVKNPNRCFLERKECGFENKENTKNRHEREVTFFHRGSAIGVCAQVCVSVCRIRTGRWGPDVLAAD